MGEYRGFDYSYNFDPRQLLYDVFITKGSNQIRLYYMCPVRMREIEDVIEGFIKRSIDIAIWYADIEKEKEE